MSDELRERIRLLERAVSQRLDRLEGEVFPEFRPHVLGDHIEALAERRRIVEWIRAEAETIAHQDQAPWAVARNLAAAIERGAHLPTSETP